jgi:hypothetical protein
LGWNAGGRLVPSWARWPPGPEYRPAPTALIQVKSLFAAVGATRFGGRRGFG